MTITFWFLQEDCEAESDRIQQDIDELNYKIKSSQSALSELGSSITDRQGELDENEALLK